MSRTVEAKKKALPKALLLVPAGATLLAGCPGPTPSGNDGGYCADPECFVIQGPDGGPELLPDGGYNCECGV